MSRLTVFVRFVANCALAGVLAVLSTLLFAAYFNSWLVQRLPGAMALATLTTAAQDVLAPSDVDTLLAVLAALCAGFTVLVLYNAFDLVQAAAVATTVVMGTAVPRSPVAVMKAAPEPSAAEASATSDSDSASACSSDDEPEPEPVPEPQPVRRRRAPSPARSDVSDASFASVQGGSLSAKGGAARVPQQVHASPDQAGARTRDTQSASRGTRSLAPSAPPALDAAEVNKVYAYDPSLGHERQTSGGTVRWRRTAANRKWHKVLSCGSSHTNFEALRTNGSSYQYTDVEANNLPNGACAHCAFRPGVSV